jgi:hypothetical protein
LEGGKEMGFIVMPTNSLFTATLLGNKVSNKGGTFAIRQTAQLVGRTLS